MMAPNNMPGPLQITTTAGSRDEAERIAAALVERRLAACVQIVGPVRSVYRWQGAVEQADEWLCLVKSTAERLPGIEAALGELHSYECPELIATPIVGGSEAYLQWLAEQTAQGEAP
jgi:periplasmic divalent cation tolerance protein